MGKTKIEVTVHRCRDIPKVQRLGKQDPYVLVKYETQEFRTKTCDDGGKDPAFNETMVFVVPKGQSTVLSLTIMNDNRRHDDVIGTARIDFVLALEQGSIHKAFPVTDAHGQAQGLIEVTVKDPEVLAVMLAAKQVKSMQLASAVESHNQALVEARAKHYGEVKRLMAPHEKVASKLAAEHMESTKTVQGDEVKEMAKIFHDPKPQAAALVEEAATELGKITKDFLKAFPAALDQEEPSAKEKFGKPLGTLNQIVDEAGAKRAQKLARAKAHLIGGIDEVLARYRASVAEACDDYEGTFNGALFRYKGEVEAHFRRVAERRSQEEADRVAPLPPGAQPVPPPPSSAAHPPAGAMGAAAPTATRGMGAPPGGPVPPYSPYPPGAPHHPAPAPLIYTDPAPAPLIYTDPAPVQYTSRVPMTEAEAATAEARAANAAANQARGEAEAARRQAEVAQQQMYQQEEQMERQAAVRKGVVGGLILGSILR